MLTVCCVNMYLINLRVIAALLLECLRLDELVERFHAGLEHALQAGNVRVAVAVHDLLDDQREVLEFVRKRRLGPVVDPRTAGVVRGTKRRSKHFPRDSDRISNFRGDMKSYSNTGENLTLFACTRDGENMLFRRGATVHRIFCLSKNILLSHVNNSSASVRCRTDLEPDGHAG